MSDAAPTDRYTEPIVPDDFEPPEDFDHPSFRLRPLTVEHNERDHDAWMSSIDHIRATPGFADGDWPSPRSSEENRDDLARHHRHFLTRVGFTWTVLAPDGPEATADVIGCVYVYPDDERDDVIWITSWVRADHAALDDELATTVREWLRSDAWPWDPAKVQDDRDT